MNILPYDLALGGDEEDKEDETPNSTVPSRNISVDVSTAVTKAVDSVSKAVVGVVNIQEAGFWNEKGEAGTGSGVIYKKKAEVPSSSPTTTSLKEPRKSSSA